MWPTGTLPPSSAVRKGLMPRRARPKHVSKRGSRMRIGLAGVGRIGAFHAKTLAALDFVDQLVVTDADLGAAKAVADELGIEVAPDTEALLASGDRRLRDHHGHPRPCAAPASGHRRGHPDLLREAGGLHPRRRPSSSPSSSRPPTCRCTSASSGGSTPVTGARGPRWSPGSSDSSTPSGPTPTTRPRRTRPTSRPPAASSATATCTTSTSSGSSPGGRWPPSTRRAPTRAPTSSPRPVTSTPPEPC